MPEKEKSYKSAFGSGEGEHTKVPGIFALNVKLVMLMIYS
jgi:hypothetical protein